MASVKRLQLHVPIVEMRGCCADIVLPVHSTLLTMSKPKPHVVPAGAWIVLEYNTRGRGFIAPRCQYAREFNSDEQSTRVSVGQRISYSATIVMIKVE